MLVLQNTFSLSDLPVGIIAIPPKAVFPNSSGNQLFPLYIAERASSKGTFKFTPVITKLVVQRVLITADTFLFVQGISISSATG
nr:hypothetical protein [Clostridium sp. ZBS14]